MSKEVWMITHDRYIDRRIFFFVDYLHKQNLAVKLFASFYANVGVAQDPDYVLRPQREKIVRRYFVAAGELEDAAAKIIDLAETLPAELSLSIKKTVCNYAKKLGYRCKFKKHLNGYLLYIFTKQYLLIHNSLSRVNEILYRTYKDDLIQKCEIAIYDFLYGKSTNEIKLNDPKVNVNTELWDAHKIIYVGNDDEYLYKFDGNSASLSEITPYLSDKSSKPDFFVNTEYDYIRFKEQVYNYTQIMKRIEDETKKSKPDIVYVADLPTLPLGIFLKNLFDAKLIMDCHEWWYKNVELWSAVPSNIAASKDYEAELYPQCDLLITVGQYMASKMSEMYKCRFEVIYSAINKSNRPRTPKSKAFLCDKYMLPENSKIAIFQGGMSTHRNLDNLARATKYLSDDAYLLLLTDGSYQNKFKKVLKKEGNPARVIWGGFKPQRELLEYTQNADIGIIPYTAENDYAECFVPNKLMEYLEAKIPIFYDSSLKELSMVISSCKVGTGYDLSNPQIFGTKLNELLHDDLELQRIKNNYLQLDNIYTYEVQEEHFGSLLKEYDIL